jgi:hypothetical protein
MPLFTLLLLHLIDKKNKVKLEKKIKKEIIYDKHSSNNKAA